MRVVPRLSHEERYVILWWECKVVYRQQRLFLINLHFRIFENSKIFWLSQGGFLSLSCSIDKKELKLFGNVVLHILYDGVFENNKIMGFIRKQNTYSYNISLIK